MCVLFSNDLSNFWGHSAIVIHRDVLRDLTRVDKRVVIQTTVIWLLLNCTNSYAYLKPDWFSFTGVLVLVVTALIILMNSGATGSATYRILGLECYTQDTQRLLCKVTPGSNGAVVWSCPPRVITKHTVLTA